MHIVASSGVLGDLGKVQMGRREKKKRYLWSVHKVCTSEGWKMNTSNFGQTLLDSGVGMYELDGIPAAEQLGHVVWGGEQKKHGFQHFPA